jgi:hypothetical protein
VCNCVIAAPSVSTAAASPPVIAETPRAADAPDDEASIDTTVPACDEYLRQMLRCYRAVPSMRPEDRAKMRQQLGESAESMRRAAQRAAGRAALEKTCAENAVRTRESLAKVCPSVVTP